MTFQDSDFYNWMTHLGGRFPLTERVSLQFHADAFNILESSELHEPVGVCRIWILYLQSQQMLNHGLGGLNPLFQEGRPRSLQLALKLAF